MLPVDRLLLVNVLHHVFIALGQSLQQCCRPGQLPLSVDHRYILIEFYDLES